MTRWRHVRAMPFDDPVNATSGKLTVCRRLARRFHIAGVDIHREHSHKK